MRLLRRKRWALTVGGLAALGMAVGFFIWPGSSETTASSPLVCPNDDKVGGHGVPNPAHPPEEAAPDDAVRNGLRDLAGIEQPFIEATEDPTLFLVKAADGQTLVATARVVRQGNGWRLDQWETCGLRSPTPDPGPGRIVDPPASSTSEPTESTGRAGA